MTTFERIDLPDGGKGFRKSDVAAPPDLFTAEAEGLTALAATITVAVPEVLRVSNSEIVTRYLPDAAASHGAWAELGRQLAALHALPAPGFGFTSDNYCGATRQPNVRCDDGHHFFAEYRLRYQLRLARDRGLLGGPETAVVDALCARLEQLLPAAPPALLHGDLWRGNVLFTAEGGWLIDPATHWGWPEADLAMTTLFGRFDPAFYSAYGEAASLEPGWESRLPLYNLYHLLNHLNLFGASYHAQVMTVAHQFS